MTRFFVRPDQIQGDCAVLDADDAYHVRTVLRMRSGEAVGILDGSGAEYPGTLEEIQKQRVRVRLASPWYPMTEPNCRITVAQALPRMAEKMERVLEHGTEIGVCGFWACRTELSQTHFEGERQEKRIGRWSKIIKSAAEQSHRARLPSLVVGGGLVDVFQEAAAYELALIADPQSQLPLNKALNSTAGTGRILIIVGPESGLTDQEVRAGIAAGIQPISLGPRILRTETAALAAAAQILYAMECVS